MLGFYVLGLGLSEFGVLAPFFFFFRVRALGLAGGC